MNYDIVKTDRQTGDKQPVLSVIIPVYNAADTIVACLNSILQADILDSEIILVDDGSTDETYLRVNEFCQLDNVRLFSKSNGGSASARNYGLSVSRGRFICFIDSDDEVDSRAFREVFESTLDLDPDIACFGIKIEDQSGFQSEIIAEDSTDSVWANFIYHPIYMHGVCNKFFKRSLIIKNNIIFENDLVVCEDMLFCAEVFSHSKLIRYFNTVAYKYKRRGNSVTNSTLAIKKSHDDKEAAHRLELYLPNEQDPYFWDLIQYRYLYAGLRFLTEVDIYSPDMFREYVKSLRAVKYLKNIRHRFMCIVAYYRIDIILDLMITIKSWKYRT